MLIMAYPEEIASMNMSDYKKYHESFMQNNAGSSAPHVFFCIFFTVQCSVYSSLRLRSCKTNKYLYEYIIIVLPMILAHTLLTYYIYVLNFTISTLLLYEVYHHSRNKTKLNKPDIVKNKIFSISIMRGLTYLITVFAILAVDFRDFPRYLAKTERYGYSLMDTGVGLFVLMSGLVHRDLRKRSLKVIIAGNLKFISVLTFLGLARYLSIKQLDYQEHVTEYGVHWNFFFTLAVCKFLSTVILYFRINSLIYSFILLFIHECTLYLGLQEWVFSDVPRDTIVSANREGLSSCLGYVSLYLFGAHIKSLLSGPSRPIHIKLLRHISIHTNFVQITLILISVSLWIELYVLSFLLPISRTLANASYCIYLEAVSVTVVSVLYSIENVLKNDEYLKVPEIIDSVNSNGLSYFLISNLLTGAINLSCRTLALSSLTTFIILNIYMILGLLCTSVIRKWGIKI